MSKSERMGSIGGREELIVTALDVGGGAVEALW